ncbi:hypothetical protein GSI_01420 [Ganoderma sinense ZZ0214-1]|uniref:Arrestin-like N-terminal domain-containing protein n=1 Tax=Ganoderma sinense ZZ0214-1 TaxID=1077348 RepID=A0A2G8SVD0_9APHY|nr:hypothetical protein GSI_01420 [Ganoderma sinense ZZ0214-1]
MWSRDHHSLTFLCNMTSILSPASTSSALTVVIPPTIHCGGGYVEGQILLNFRQLHEENFDEVCVQLSGNIHTRLRRKRSLDEENHQLLSSVVSVWTRGSAYPQPGTDVLHLPFRFPLPDDLPPSFYFRASEITSSVLYAIETTGVRRGVFKANRKVHTPIAVLPKDDVGVGVRMGLGERAGLGSHTGWKNVWAEEKIREGFWGELEHATARVMVSIPDVPVLPLFTPLPFLITVTTMTAPMTRAKALEHPPDKPIFPTPPQKHSDIDFRLCRNLVLQPQGSCWTTDEAVACFFGDGTIAQDVVAEVEVAEKEWHPEPEETASGGEEMGRWLQRMSFSSKFTLNVPPTFSAPTIVVNYYLSLKVPFPGMGNDMLLKVPVTITSGINEPWLKPEPDSQVPSPSPSQPRPKPEPQGDPVNDDSRSDAPVSDFDLQQYLSTHDLSLPP